MRDKVDPLVLQRLLDFGDCVTRCWTGAKRCGSQQLLRLLATLSSMTSLLSLRCEWNGGFASKKRAAKHTRCFSDNFAHAISRKGAVQNEEDAAELFALIGMQLSCVFQTGAETNSQVIYMAKSGCSSYVGRTKLFHN